MTVDSNTTQDKQITIEVPEDRVAEFYAFYGRFLAGATGRRGRGRGPGHRHGHGPGGHHRCGPHGRRDDTEAQPEPATGGETQTA
jgi:hypothetical protein